MTLTGWLLAARSPKAKWRRRQLGSVQSWAPLASLAVREGAHSSAVVDLDS